ncbi:hypothetical protein RM572_22520 [Streptomyces sp. DSM 42041]|uniref:Uncharacterized protein n=1 Tax=Streptomyces hazeniae TaxID=3075538 RepID=A0ABU2NX09_9ACTN|nr:hypothetical protein [Streptomyces sp. DSM 42041]MDT0381537.1 hypothetical protein [Streptomyces sp. DSM 42041]
MSHDEDQQMTPDLPPPVEAPELWRPEDGDDDEETGGTTPPDPEHGPGDDTGTGEPPD